MSLFAELKRRNVFKVATAYIVTAWLVLQVADVVLNNIDAPQWLFRVLLLFLALGFPFALIFAWAYEVTPEGIKREHEVDRSKSITHTTGRRINVTIIVLLVVAVSFLFVDNYILRRDRNMIIMDQTSLISRTLDRSIAVLPLADQGEDGANTIFVDGLHSDLITHIAKVASIKVISRTSVIQYRDTIKTIPQIAEELGVATVLEGGVQRVGDRIRINVQLIDASKDENLWAENYDRQLTANNFFDVQAQIASQIAVALNAVLTPDDKQRLEQRPTQDLKAYEAYLDGRRNLESRKVTEMRYAVGQFEEAIERDPNFVLAYVGLAETYMLLNSYGDLSKQDMLNRARPLASKAHNLDDQIGAVYNVLGALAEYDGDIVGAEAYYRKSIELSPDYTMARHWLGLLLLNYTERIEESAEIFRSALAVDPRSVNHLNQLANAQKLLGRTDEALDLCIKALEINPDFTVAYQNIAFILLEEKRDPVAAMHWLQKLASLDIGRDAAPAHVSLTLGDVEAAEKWVRIHQLQFPNDPWVLELQPRIEWSRGDYEKLMVVALQVLQLSRDVFEVRYPLHFYRNHLLRINQSAHAFDAYELFFPELVKANPRLSPANVEAAVDLVLVLRGMGRVDESNQLLEMTVAFLESAPNPAYYSSDMLLAQLFAMNGDTSAALASIRKAVDTDWIGYWYDLPDQNPNLTILHDNPEYIVMMDEVKAFLAEELQKLRDLEKRGILAAQPEQLKDAKFDLTL